MHDSTKEQINKMTNSLIQSATEMNTISHDAVTATLQSAMVMIKGCGDLYSVLSSLTQKYIEQTAIVTQTVLSANSMNDIVTTQNSLMKNGFDTIMSEANTLSQLSSRIAQQAAEPVTKHVNETMSKISRIRAA